MKYLYLLLFLPSAYAQPCHDRYLQHLKTDLALPYQAFDQTMDAGFRPLAKDCPAEAVDLIKNYIVINAAKEDSLRWHIAQLLGKIHAYEEAEIYALSTLRDVEKNQFKWNDYVMGYVAYWRQDIDMLQEKISILEQHANNNGNAINAKLLTTFLKELQTTHKNHDSAH